MSVSSLTPDGIECMFSGESVVLQIIESAVQATSALETEEFLQATLSDGFAFVRKAWIAMKYFPKKNYEMAVIRMTAVPEKGKKRKDGGSPSFIINPIKFQILVTGLKESIGKPIPYKEYCASGKVNEMGSRIIPTQKKQAHEVEDTEDEFDLIQKKAAEHKKETKVEQKKVPPPKQPTRPIERLQQKKRESIKPEISHNSSDYEKINQLYLGLDGFKIAARLLFVSPIKTITNKKGNLSELINLEFGDSSGRIMATAFGEAATRFSTLEVDRVYSISAAGLAENVYKGKKQLKMTLSQSTKLLMLNDALAPKIQHFCISVKQLAQANKDEIVSVLCCVRQGERIDFISKKGQKINKKILHLYDLENQLTSELSMIGENACKDYPDGIYILANVEVGEYQGERQYKASFTFEAKLLPKHPLANHVAKLLNMEFTETDPHVQKSAGASNFLQLRDKSQQLPIGENLWTELVCYLKGIRYGQSKTTYLSCPHCRKKVTEEDESDCIFCKKRYTRGQHRYILSVNLYDSLSSVWVSVYDDIGEILLALPGEENFPAGKFKDLTEEEIKERVEELRYKKIKVLIVSAKESYNEQVRVKHKVAKLKELNFEKESQSLLEKIKKTLPH